MYRYSDLQKLKKIVQICRVNSILDENVNSKSFIFTVHLKQPFIPDRYTLFTIYLSFLRA